MAQKPAAAKPADPTIPKKSGNKLLIVVIAVLVLVIAGGAGWYFTKGKHDAPHAEEVKIVPPKIPLFVALEPFTVNLRHESNDQYLQMGITLKVYEVDVETKIKASLPEIRSRILQLITTKTAAELVTAEGKNKLVKEIITMSNTVIGIAPAPVPVHAAVAVAPAEAAPHAATPVAEAAPVAVPAHAPAAPVEAKGIVDVLFTSFIIQ